MLPTPSWTPPPPGVIKLNTNAGTSLSGAALTVVSRDSQGHVLMAWARSTPKLPPLQAEAAALH